MARRMIDPQAIIKSQIVDDKYTVDLHEILEKYGTQNEWADKSITLQFYSKQAADDTYFMISCDRGIKGHIIINTAITITKNVDGDVYINGLMIDGWGDKNLLSYIVINSGDYEEFGIILSSEYPFDVHVIKV